MLADGSFNIPYFKISTKMGLYEQIEMSELIAERQGGDTVDCRQM